MKTSIKLFISDQQNLTNFDAVW
ncbi:uncharacterized protein METZ01_LOCUS231628, partial [marine metagenome]